jgi:hypothetical protein
MFCQVSLSDFSLSGFCQVSVVVLSGFYKVAVRSPDRFLSGFCQVSVMLCRVCVRFLSGFVRFSVRFLPGFCQVFVRFLSCFCPFP